METIDDTEFNSVEELMQWWAKGSKVISAGCVFGFKGGFMYCSPEKEFKDTGALSTQCYPFIWDTQHLKKFRKYLSWTDDLNSKDPTTWKVCKVKDDYNKCFRHIAIISEIHTHGQNVLYGTPTKAFWNKAIPLTTEEFQDLSLVFGETHE